MRSTNTETYKRAREAGFSIVRAMFLAELHTRIEAAVERKKPILPEDLTGTITALLACLGALAVLGFAIVGFGHMYLGWVTIT